MDLTELINHPEQMDRDTLYELRSLLALYPYYQSARLMMLQNLFLLHDPTFDEELRRAAIYITDRRVLFQLVEAAHYQMQPSQDIHGNKPQPSNPTPLASTPSPHAPKESRTLSLIDSFLNSIPPDAEQETKPKRKPTPADAAVDYVAYLLETEDKADNSDVPEMKGQDLIDTFINNDKGRIVLSDTPEFVPSLSDTPEPGEIAPDEGYFTETLARIYIKQGNYSNALKIIQQLSLVYPKKNAYFADQIRFLEKLIINNNKKQ